MESMHLYSLFTCFFAICFLSQPHVDDSAKSSIPPDDNDNVRRSNANVRVEPTPSCSSVDFDLAKREADELRRQIQVLKTQSLTILEQARKATDRADAATRELNESKIREEAATLKATQAVGREQFVMEIVTRANQDIVGSWLNEEAELKRVNIRVAQLMEMAAKYDVDFWKDEERCRTVVQFEDRTAQARELIDFCRKALSMTYRTLFPRNPQPENFEALMELFKDPKDIHRFIKAQMVCGAKFVLIWVQIYCPKLDMAKVAEALLQRLNSNRAVNVERQIKIVTGPAEMMIDSLLEYDKRFFKDGRYDEATSLMKKREARTSNRR